MRFVMYSMYDDVQCTYSGVLLVGSKSTVTDLNLYEQCFHTLQL